MLGVTWVEVECLTLQPGPKRSKYSIMSRRFQVIVTILSRYTVGRLSLAFVVALLGSFLGGAAMT